MQPKINASACHAGSRARALFIVLVLFGLLPGIFPVSAEDNGQEVITQGPDFYASAIPFFPWGITGMQVITVKKTLTPTPAPTLVPVTTTATPAPVVTVVKTLAPTPAPTPVPVTTPVTAEPTKEIVVRVTDVPTLAIRTLPPTTLTTGQATMLPTSAVTGTSAPTACVPPQKYCNGACVDAQNDARNCGSCGNDCGENMCCDGRCITFDLRDDNCGACGRACAENQRCLYGSCYYVCTKTDGSEYYVPTFGEDGNCGGCGITCGANSVCENWQCRRTDCTDGYTSVSNECIPESDQYCGTLAVTCNSPAESCYNGYCRCNEAAGYINCNDECVLASQSCNCGRDCESFETCSNGQCVDKCPNPLESWCGEEAGCKNTYFDSDNCQYCGMHCDGICFAGNCVHGFWG